MVAFLCFVSSNQRNFQNRKMRKDKFFNFSGFDFRDIVDDLFGGNESFEGFSSFGNRSRQKRTRKGDDVLVEMNVSFMEAALGSKKEVEITTTEICDECHGVGGFDEGF